jgi:hypothetical protein
MFIIQVQILEPLTIIDAFNTHEFKYIYIYIFNINIKKYKASLIIQGFTQVPNVDFG